jgi:hypothetical protein
MTQGATLLRQVGALWRNLFQNRLAGLEEHAFSATVKGQQSCHVERSSHWRRRSSSASRALLRFQPMPSHIAVGALVLAALAFITQASIAAVFTVAQPYAVEWR